MGKLRADLRETFSEKGELSSKRVLGAIVLLVVLGVWAEDAFTEGFTEHTTMVAEMFIGVAGVLLGISSVTSAFSKKGNSNEEASN